MTHGHSARLEHMVELPTHNCLRCGSTCRTAPRHYQDGRIEVGGLYCQQEGCPLRGRNQLHYGRQGFRETSFGANWSARYTAFGPPSSGEANALPTSKTFAAVLRRDFHLSLSEPERVAVAVDDRVDARATWSRGGYLNLQVTRALPSEDYKAQRHAGDIERTHGLAFSVDLLRGAIERKQARVRGDITLLIDGREAVHLAFPAPTLFAHKHGKWARELGWESVWVVGPSFAKRLDWSASEALPPSWPTN